GAERNLSAGPQSQFEARSNFTFRIFLCAVVQGEATAACLRRRHLGTPHASAGSLDKSLPVERTTVGWSVCPGNRRLLRLGLDGRGENWWQGGAHGGRLTRILLGRSCQPFVAQSDRSGVVRYSRKGRHVSDRRWQRSAAVKACLDPARSTAART